MATSLRRKASNPRLGIYFGILASLLAALVLLVLIFEQLGANDGVLRGVMLFGPLALFALVGIASWTEAPLDFFVAGRRVPSVYSGTVTGVTAVGGTGLVALTGVFFLNGFDAWCIGTGIVAGLAVSGIMIAPYLRKFGGFTLATYLGRRFDSRLVRVATAAVVALPLLLLLAAELSIAASAATLLTGMTRRSALAIIVGTVIASVLLGGMRAQTWSGAAQGMVALAALIVPASMVAILAGNLPLPQLSYGPTLRAIGRLESLQGVPIPVQPQLAFDLADAAGLTAISQRLAQPFGSVGATAYVLTTLLIMAGIAAAPWLLNRPMTTQGVYESRKAQGWAALTAGIILLTLTAIAVFLRDHVMDGVVGQTAQKLPEWFKLLQSLGFADIDRAASGRLPLTSVMFGRDVALYSLPVSAGFPAVVLYTVLAGAVAAAMAAAAAATMTLASTVVEDALAGGQWQPLSPRLRLVAVRGAIVVVALTGAVFTLAVPPDPLRHVLWALALTAGSLFPVIVLSVWWKRLNAPGALASMATGLGVTAIAIFLGEANALPLKGVLAAAVGLPAAVIAAFVVSNISAPPNKNSLELIMDMRVPGGETIYDREMRLLRLKQRTGQQ